MISVIVAILSIFISALIVQTIVRVQKNSNKLEKKVDSPKIIVPPSSGPQAFLDHIKESLPRGVGLIYEIKSYLYERESFEHYYWGQPLDGDFMVDVAIIDPISDNVVSTCTFNERKLSKADVTDRILSQITTAIRRIEGRRIAGQIDIVS